jgi:AcrR family transcriptional regulator
MISAILSAIAAAALPAYVFETEEFMPTRRRRRAPPKRSSSGDPSQRMIDAALELAVSKGWRRTGMGDIAAAAGVPLDEAYRLFRSKFALLAAFRRGIDEAVLAGAAPSSTDSPRDRLFDVLMRRLEALQPHRLAIRALLRDSMGDPVMVKALPGFARSMAWMLQAASISVSGCWGRLIGKLVAALYLSVLPVFLRDESADLGTTMAALDRRLRQAETFINTFQSMANRVPKPRS